MRGRAAATVRVSALLATALVLTGCAAQSHPLPTLPVPAKNLQNWTMPLDQYVSGQDDSITDAYAENLLIAPCLAKDGYDFPVPWRNLDALHGPSFNAAGARLFTVALASEYGYHVAPNPDPSAQRWQEIVNSSPQMSDQEYEAFSSCLATARKTVHPLPESAEIATGYTNDAMTKAESDDQVKDKASAWKRCMRSTGVADLPDSPREMPPQSLVDRYGLAEDGAAGPASEEELRIATADATCQETSGYHKALYDAEWRFQLQVMADHADDLNRAYEVLKKHRKEVAAVIADHAPSPSE